MSWYFKLNDAGEPVPVDDAIEWGEWFETADRSVAKDIDEQTGWCVSTVFMGLDHAYGDGPPILWETLVFGGPLNGEMTRYATRAAALDGHRPMCARVMEELAGGRPVNEP